MEITNESLTMLIFIVICVCLFGTIVKYGIKIAISLVAILVIFKIGFIMTGTDLNETFQIDRIFKEETADQIIGFFDEFREKGDAYAVMDINEVYDMMVESIDAGVNITMDVVKDLDLDSFAKSLADKIKESNLQDDINKDEIVETLSEILPDLTDEQIDELATDVLNKI